MRCRPVGFVNVSLLEESLMTKLDESLKLMRDMSVWTGRVDPEPDTLRWHQHVEALAIDTSDSGKPPGLCLLGFASDAGVKRNKGRPGAAAGPTAIRQALANIAWHGHMPLYDAGTVACPDDELEASQAAYGESVTQLLNRGHAVVALGGGHEIAYGSWLGLAAHIAPSRNKTHPPKIGIINFDAHFDLRDPAYTHSSGTPFAQIAEDSAARNWPLYLCLRWRQ